VARQIGMGTASCPVQVTGHFLPFAHRASASWRPWELRQAGSYPYLLIFMSALICAAANPEQAVLHTNLDGNEDGATFRVAIIGAGIAGSSAAYHIRKNPQASRASIAIFDAESRLGGRVKTIHTADEEYEAFEAGALYFYSDDWCLVDAVDDLGLGVKSFEPEYEIWNGHGFARDPICHVDDPPTEWHTYPAGIGQMLYWSIQTLDFNVRLAWRHGLSLWRLRRAASSVQNQWRRFAQSEPFGNVREEAERIGLLGQALELPGSYFRRLGIGHDFQSSFVDPCTRATAGDAGPSGLAAVLGVASTRPPRLRLRNGNIRLVEMMVRLSEADVKLSTRVTSITSRDNGRYRVSFIKDDTSGDADFNMVVLAMAPELQPSLPFDDANTATRPPRSADAHVTLLSGLQDFNVTFLGPGAQRSNAPPPSQILFTADGSGARGFLSLESTLESVYFANAWSQGLLCGQGDNVYRVVSRHRLDDYDILALFGEEPSNKDDPLLLPVTLLDRQVWPGAFIAHDHGSSDWSGVIEPMPNLLHLGRAAPILDTLEMGCRMGRNGARLARDWRPGYGQNQSGSMHFGCAVNVQDAGIV
jgi:hypothetical protein